MPPLTLLEVNLKEREGMPEKARNGYAALSILMDSKLGIARKTCSAAVFLNACKDLHTHKTKLKAHRQTTTDTLTCLFPSCPLHTERGDSSRRLELSPGGRRDELRIVLVKL